MRTRAAWPDSVSGWCFGISFAILLGVIAVSVAAPVVIAAGFDGSADILWRVVQVGFAALAGSFLLGILCSVGRSIKGEQKGRWRL